jgi:nucleotidyltransferase/DNA polymerase involved in DNA repair
VVAATSGSRPAFPTLLRCDVDHIQAQRRLGLPRRWWPQLDHLADWFGPTIGPRLRVLARGGSSRAITTEPWLARSKSRQVTFTSDLTDSDAIGQEVAATVRELCAEIRAAGRQVTHVGVTVRTRSFFTQVKTCPSSPRSKPAPSGSMPLSRSTLTAMSILGVIKVPTP